MLRWIRHRGWLAAATFALLWHALHPLSMPLLAQARAAWVDPTPALAAICHGGGAAAQPAGDGSTLPDHDHCPWCRSSSADPLPATPRPALALAGAVHETPAVAPAPFHPIAPHRPGHARGPPAPSAVS